MIRYAPVILIGRFIRWVARIRKPGGGAAIPGVVVNRLAPGFLPNVLKHFNQGTVFVTGTAGKSTTTRVLAAVVSAHGVRVFTNPSTANISQGLTSAIVKDCNLFSQINADLAILEVDEGHAALLAQKASPRYSVLLNVCLDQVDRFFDPQIVENMLTTVARNTSGTVIFNADDARTSRAAAMSSVSTSFGMSQPFFAQAGAELGYSSSRSHSDEVVSRVELVSVRGQIATVSIDKDIQELRLPSAGIHYGVDVVAAISAAQAILGDAFDPELAISTVNAIDPVFGRGESVVVAGQSIDFVLIQNPTSFRLNIASLSVETEALMIAIGSDVRDFSYLWPVSLQRFNKIAIASGSKANAVALHCLYQGVDVAVVEPDLPTALELFLAQPAPKSGRKTIIFSADAMRRTRQHFGLSEQREWS